MGSLEYQVCYGPSLFHAHTPNQPGEEYLNYAVKNREEWEQKGKSIVAETVEAVKEEFCELKV